MISLEAARERILSALSPLPTPETLPLVESAGRVSALDITAPLNLPAFDNSAVDGYAVRAADLTWASQNNPVRLTQISVVAAGEASRETVTEGTCMRVFTGAAIPPGADAVVMQEDIELDPNGVLFREPASPWQGVRMAGEDVRRGQILVAKGERLRPAHLGLLASSGLSTAVVHARPRISLLSTGNELVEPGELLTPGKIYDSNGVLLSSLAGRDGFPVLLQKRIPDTLEGTRASLLEASRMSDVLITTGGVSVGELDLVKAAMTELGGTVDLWRIAVKPGKPFAWGRLEGAFWFGLPGNPVSAFVTWWLLVRPALFRLMGMSGSPTRRVLARLGAPVRNNSDRRHFLRVHLDEQGWARPSGTQASHVQSSLASANALLDVPPGSLWEAGREVLVECLD